MAAAHHLDQLGLQSVPLLHPLLNNVYAKLKGKGQEACVWVNTAIREDLGWARMKLDNSDGAHFLKSLSWELSEALCVAKTDTCPEGFAFWYPQLDMGFMTSTPSTTPLCQIIFYKALAVLSTLDNAYYHFPSGSKIVIFTDNSVTVLVIVKGWPNP